MKMMTIKILKSIIKLVRNLSTSLKINNEYVNYMSSKNKILLLSSFLVLVLVSEFTFPFDATKSKDFLINRYN